MMFAANATSPSVDCDIVTCELNYLFVKVLYFFMKFVNSNLVQFSKKRYSVTSVSSGHYDFSLSTFHTTMLPQKLATFVKINF